MEAEQLNSLLKAQSYACGHIQTPTDSQYIAAIDGGDKSQYLSMPAVRRWYNHIKARAPLPAAPPCNLNMSNSEQTYIMVKPDGVQRGLVGDIISRFEKRGYQLAALKMKTPSRELLEAHYCDLKTKKFFPGLVNFMTSGPVVCMVWQGKDAVKQGRAMLGETNPLSSKPGSIRGDFCIDMGRNICHGSDSVESATNEIAMWFDKGEVQDYKMSLHSDIYE